MNEGWRPAAFLAVSGLDAASSRSVPKYEMKESCCQRDLTCVTTEHVSVACTKAPPPVHEVLPLPPPGALVCLGPVSSPTTPLCLPQGLSHPYAVLYGPAHRKAMQTASCLSALLHNISSGGGRGQGSGVDPAVEAGAQGGSGRRRARQREGTGAGAGAGPGGHVGGGGSGGESNALEELLQLFCQPSAAPAPAPAPAVPVQASDQAQGRRRITPQPLMPAPAPAPAPAVPKQGRKRVTPQPLEPAAGAAGGAMAGSGPLRTQQAQQQQQQQQQEQWGVCDGAGDVEGEVGGWAAAEDEWEEGGEDEEVEGWGATRVVITSTAELSDAEREALWQSYIRDKERMVEMMGVSEWLVFPLPRTLEIGRAHAGPTHLGVPAGKLRANMPDIQSSCVTQRSLHVLNPFLLPPPPPPAGHTLSGVV